jgi:hypothetical protein
MNTATATPAKKVAAGKTATHTADEIVKFGKGKKAQPGSKTVKLPFVKSTAGTHVYGIAEKEGICRQVYLQKDELPETPPKAITLTVAWE